MLQISDGLLILIVYTVFLDCCILMVFRLCFCLQYLEGLKGQQRFTYVLFEYVADVSLISVFRTQLNTITIYPPVGLRGWIDHIGNEQ